MAIDCTGFATEQLRNFVTGEVARQDTCAIDLERFKQLIEIYLADLKTAVLSDLRRLCDEISSIEDRVTTLEGP